MKKKLAILALAIGSIIPAGALAGPPNFECPGGPPGHCKNGNGNGNGNQRQEQEQQQQQSQSQSQCLISVAVLGDATCGP